MNQLGYSIVNTLFGELPETMYLTASLVFPFLPKKEIQLFKELTGAYTFAEGDTFPSTINPFVRYKYQSFCY